MKFQEFLKCKVGGESLDAVVRDSVLGPTLGALDLALHVVHEALHARLHAVRVLTW